MAHVATLPASLNEKARPRLCGPGTPLVEPRDAAPLAGEPAWASRAIPHFVTWEKYVGRHLCNLSDVYFVQLGANCGLNVPRCTLGGDPIFEYASQCVGWRGAALEPVPSTYRRLRQHYHHANPAVRTIRAAVSSGTSLQSWNMTITSTRGTVNRLLHSEAERRRAAHTTTRVYTTAGLWQRLRPRRVDLLVIDVEGSEARLLAEQPLPHPRPRLILFEHAHLKQQQQTAIAQALASQGYEHVEDLKHQDKMGRNMPAQDRLYGLRQPPDCSLAVAAANATAQEEPALAEALDEVELQGRAQRWLLTARTGICGVTSEGNQGDCADGDSGAFGLSGPGERSSRDQAVAACIGKCLECSRCNFIAVSVSWGDCSWYHRCQLDGLLPAPPSAAHLSGVVRSANSGTLDDLQRGSLAEATSSMSSATEAQGRRGVVRTQKPKRVSADARRRKQSTPPTRTRLAFSHAYARWRAVARAGSCGITRDAGDCANGDRGVLPVKYWQRSSLRILTLTCAHMCAGCSRCNFISVSVMYSDCSWYHSCELNATIPDHTSLRAAFDNSHLSGEVSSDLKAAMGMPRQSANGMEADFSSSERAALFDNDRFLEDPAVTVAVAARDAFDANPVVDVKLSTGGARTGIIIASHNKPPVWGAMPGQAAPAGAWNTSRPPCKAPAFTRWLWAQNLAYALRHGYALYYAQTGYKRYRGRVRRSAKWFKLPAILGLLESGRHEQLVYLDTDVSVTGGPMSVDEWQARIGVPMAGPRPSIVAGQDAEQANVTNTGFVIYHDSRRTRGLLRYWWSWPMLGADLNAGTRHRWDLIGEQGVFNQALKADARFAPALHLVHDPGQLYSPPGVLSRHFTGYCPILAKYAHLVAGREQPSKCLCWLSHFGPQEATALLRGPVGSRAPAPLEEFDRVVTLPYSLEQVKGEFRVRYFRYT